MASPAQNSAPQDLKPRAAVRRERPLSQSALARSDGLRPGCAPRATGSEPAQAPPPRTGRPGARETPAAPGAKLEDKKNAKKHEAAEKGGTCSHLPFLLTPEAKVPQPPLNPPAQLARASTA